MSNGYGFGHIYAVYPPASRTTTMHAAKSQIQHSQDQIWDLFLLHTPPDGLHQPSMSNFTFKSIFSIDLTILYKRQICIFNLLDKEANTSYTASATAYHCWNRTKPRTSDLLLLNMQETAKCKTNICTMYWLHGVVAYKML